VVSREIWFASFIARAVPPAVLARPGLGRRPDSTGGPRSSPEENFAMEVSGTGNTRCRRNVIWSRTETAVPEV
jgi:hypothetical protein